MGESSSKDGATRSRYAQIHVSIHQRIGDGSARYPRIQNDCKHYFHLGRWVMENRAAFAERALDILDNWNQSQTVRSNIPNDRVRLVYGVAFACYIAAGQMGLRVFLLASAMPLSPLLRSKAPRRASSFSGSMVSCRYSSSRRGDSSTG